MRLRVCRRGHKKSWPLISSFPGCPQFLLCADKRTKKKSSCCWMKTVSTVLQVRSRMLSLRKTMLSGIGQQEVNTGDVTIAAWRSMCVCCLTCDDGGGLASHLVLVHILPIIQFPLYQDPGPGRARLRVRIRIQFSCSQGVVLGLQKGPYPFLTYW